MRRVPGVRARRRLPRAAGLLVGPPGPPRPAPGAPPIGQPQRAKSRLSAGTVPQAPVRRTTRLRT
eukprot:12120544-Alexandrium_andersonii.AAC.1